MGGQYRRRQRSPAYYNGMPTEEMLLKLDLGDLSVRQKSIEIEGNSK